MAKFKVIEIDRHGMRRPIHKTVDVNINSTITDETISKVMETYLGYEPGETYDIDHIISNDATVAHAMNENVEFVIIAE